MEKYERYLKSVKDGYKEFTKLAKDQHSDWAKWVAFDNKIVSIKLNKAGPYGGKNEYINGRRLYTVTVKPKKNLPRKGHPFRSVK